SANNFLWWWKGAYRTSVNSFVSSDSPPPFKLLIRQMCDLAAPGGAIKWIDRSARLGLIDVVAGARRGATAHLMPHVIAQRAAIRRRGAFDWPRVHTNSVTVRLASTLTTP